MGVVIIALDTLSLKVSQLVLELRTRGLDDVHVMSAVTPQGLGNFESVTPASGFVDTISPIERAISHSHNQARLLARQQGWDWALILEEDAMVTGTKDSLDLMIQEFDHLQLNFYPVAIHLFPEQHGLLGHINKGTLYKVYWVPDYAVGYLLNSAALRESTESFATHTIQVADWPDLMRSLKWWAPKRSWALHPMVSEEISATQRTRKIAQRSIPLVRKILSRGYWIGFLLPFFAKLFKQYGNHEIPATNLRSVIISSPAFFRRWI